MKSKTSLFNRTIVLNLLQRYWVGFAAYLCIFGGVTLLPLLNALQENGWYPTDVPYYAALLQMMSGLGNIIVVNFITVAVAAALLFSHLYTPRHTGLMASLPIKRETMYFSVSAAVVGGMTLCNVAVFALCLLVELLYGQVHLGALGILLGVSVLTIITFFGLAAFCCMLTGNIFAGPAVYFIFNFLTVGAESLLYELLIKLVYGINNNLLPKTMFLSPVLQVGNSVNFDYEPIYTVGDHWVNYTWQMEGMGVLAIYTIVGLVFLWLGMLLYKNRRMETAGDTIAIEILKPVFRLCCTVGGGLLFAVFMRELLYQFSPTGAMAAAYIAVLLIIGGILGYFISQMLITKSVNVFRKGWKSIAVYAVCVIALTAAIETDLFGYERKLPALDEIKEVTVNGFNGNVVTFDETENIETVLALHESIIAGKEFHELEYNSPEAALYLGQFDEPAAEFNKRTFRITYTLQNDKTLQRRYTIAYGPNEIRDMSSDIRTLEALMNTEEGIAERCIVDYPVTAENMQGVWIDYVEAETYENRHFSDLAPSDMARLYTECILPDIADGSLGVLDYIEDRDYALSKYNCIISIELYGKAIENQYRSISYEGYKHIEIYPTLDATRTMAFLKEHGIEPAVVYDSKVADGYDYNDLGRYKVDGEEGYCIELTTDTRSYPPSAAQVIGGAEQSTAIAVID